MEKIRFHKYRAKKILENNIYSQIQGRLIQKDKNKIPFYDLDNMVFPSKG